MADVRPEDVSEHRDHNDAVVRDVDVTRKRKRSTILVGPTGLIKTSVKHVMEDLHWTEIRADAVILIALLAAAIKYTTGVDRVLDVAFYDESLYLIAGVKLAARGLYCPECGPLYAPLYNAWYYLLSFLTRDNLALYWLNYKIVTIIPPLLAYVLLRRNNVSYLVSSAISVLLLVSAANIPIWPKVSNFAVIVVLLFLIPASRTNFVPRILSLGALCAFVTAYARPEYFLTFVILVSLLAGGILFRKEWRKLPYLLELGGVALVGAVVVAAIGWPVSGYRSLCAFGQHFALYWVEWTGSDLHPWVDWEAILAQNFGQVHGMLDVVRNNPQLFLKHVASNIMGVVGSFHMMFPDHLFDDKVSKLALVAVLAWVFYVRRDAVRRNFTVQRSYLAVVGLFLLAGLIALVLVFPRPHYFVFPVILITTSLALLLSARDKKREFPGWKQVVLLSLLIVAVTPSRYLHLGDEKQVNTRTISLVQSMHITAPVNILEAEGGFNIYLGDNFQRVGESEKNAGFREFLASRKIGMVVLTDLLSTDLRFKSDSEWKDFLLHYEDWGFSEVDVPKSDIKVIVRKDLLPQPSRAAL